MNNDWMVEFRERLRQLEGLLFTTLALLAIVFVMLAAVLTFQLQPELPGRLAQSVSPAALSQRISEAFSPPLRRVFKPVDEALAAVDSMVLARFVTLAFFIGTMVWVFVGLKRQYVNLEAPSKKFYHDLRFWTIASMLPHLIVYFCL